MYPAAPGTRSQIPWVRFLPLMHSSVLAGLAVKQRGLLATLARQSKRTAARRWVSLRPKLEFARRRIRVRRQMPLRLFQHGGVAPANGRALGKLKACLGRRSEFSVELFHAYVSDGFR